MGGVWVMKDEKMPDPDPAPTPNSNPNSGVSPKPSRRSITDHEEGRGRVEER